MLIKFFEEWNNALKNESIKKTQCDENNNILWQTGEIVFRDTVIQIHRKSNGDGAYTAELFVPSTNKFISNQRFPTKAKCAEAILLALTPGNEKDAIRHARVEKKAEALRKKIIGERIEVLRKINMEPEDFDWFCNVLNTNLQAGRSYHDGALVTILSKWYNEISGTKTYLSTLDSRDACYHVERMFEMVAMILNRAIRRNDGRGDLRLPYAQANRLYRNMPDQSVRLPKGIRNVKEIFLKIDDELKDNAKFMYVVQILSEYYHSKTQMTTQQLLAAVEDRRARAKERRLRAVEGYESTGNITVFGEVPPQQKRERNGNRNDREFKKRHSNRPYNKNVIKDNRVQDASVTNDRPGMTSVAEAIGNSLDGLIFEGSSK